MSAFLLPKTTEGFIREKHFAAKLARHLEGNCKVVVHGEDCLQKDVVLTP